MSRSADQHAELERRLQDGDDEVLAELFALHRDRLWRAVRFRIDRRLSSRVDPDDILQEAYLDAAQRIDHFRKKETMSFFVWLRQIVGQTLINAHRRHLGFQMRDARREVSIHNSRYPQATSVSLAARLLGQLTSPSQAVMREELSQQMQAAVESMDPIDQEVIALRHFEELTNSEVAEVLEIQQKAASIRYVRALSRLKKILNSIPGFADGSTTRTNA